jgi:adenosylcobinamide-GDP ribazoletransferase
MSLGGGLRLAVTTFSIWPLRAGAVDRGSGAVAMALAPAMGAALGGLGAAIGYGLYEAGASALVSAVVFVIALVLASRALHLDGLADTVDAFGSYADRDRALAIMKSPEVGPFGVVAIVLVLGLDVAAAESLFADHRWWAVLVGVALGRVSVPIVCRRGVPAARPDGLGALVAGTVPPVVPVLWLVGLGLAGWFALSQRPWLAVIAAVGVVLLVLALIHRAQRRFGGISGDVIGAACELATALSLAVLALGH